MSRAAAICRVQCRAGLCVKGHEELGTHGQQICPVTLFVCPNGVNWEGGGLSGPA